MLPLPLLLGGGGGGEGGLPFLLLARAGGRAALPGRDLVPEAVIVGWLVGFKLGLLCVDVGGGLGSSRDCACAYKYMRAEHTTAGAPRVAVEEGIVVVLVAHVLRQAHLPTLLFQFYFVLVV